MLLLSKLFNYFVSSSFCEMFQFQNWSWLVRFTSKTLFSPNEISKVPIFFSLSFRHLRFTPDFWRYWTRKKKYPTEKLATIYFFLLFLFYTIFSGYMWMLWVCVEEQAKAALRASAIPLSMVLCAHSSYDNDVVCLLRLIISFTDDYQWTIATIELSLFESRSYFQLLHVKHPHSSQLWGEEIKRVNFFIVRYFDVIIFASWHDDKESRQILSICGLFCGCSTEWYRHDSTRPGDCADVIYLLVHLRQLRKENINEKRITHVSGGGGGRAWHMSHLLTCGRKCEKFSIVASVEVFFQLDTYIALCEN